MISYRQFGHVIRTEFQCQSCNRKEWWASSSLLGSRYLINQKRFVAGFATLAAPLHALTKKNVPFVWTDATETAFSQMRSALTSSSIS
uniref:Reverse transcriptase/retrotransposon-derived protein RNase H-like domain-containing protein n=1 Tax=Amphimedon queenslandica TaxID=400682 RepID=A0A1X7V232_AMPQE